MFWSGSLTVTCNLVAQLILQLNKLAAINPFLRKCLYKLGEELSKHNFEPSRSPLLTFLLEFFAYESTSDRSSFAIRLTSKKYMLGVLAEVLFHKCLKMLEQPTSINVSNYSKLKHLYHFKLLIFKLVIYIPQVLLQSHQFF